MSRTQGTGLREVVRLTLCVRPGSGLDAEVRPRGLGRRARARLGASGHVRRAGGGATSGGAVRRSRRRAECDAMPAQPLVGAAAGRPRPGGPALPGRAETAAVRRTAGALTTAGRTAVLASRTVPRALGTGPRAGLRPRRRHDDDRLAGLGHLGTEVVPGADAGATVTSTPRGRVERAHVAHLVRQDERHDEPAAPARAVRPERCR